MMHAFTYAALWRNGDALPRLLQLLPEPARSEVSRIAKEASALTPDELSVRIHELRNRDLEQAEAAFGSAQICPPRILEWRRRTG